VNFAIFPSSFFRAVRLSAALTLAFSPPPETSLIPLKTGVGARLAFSLDTRQYSLLVNPSFAPGLARAIGIWPSFVIPIPDLSSEVPGRVEPFTFLLLFDRNDGVSRAPIRKSGPCPRVAQPRPPPSNPDETGAEVRCLHKVIWCLYTGPTRLWLSFPV